MQAIFSVEGLVTAFISSWWTPLFMAIFFAILAYALWPKNKRAFDHAARMPLED